MISLCFQFGSIINPNIYCLVTKFVYTFSVYLTQHHGFCFILIDWLIDWSLFYLFIATSLCVIDRHDCWLLIELLLLIQNVIDVFGWFSRSLHFLSHLHVFNISKSSLNFKNVIICNVYNSTIRKLVEFALFKITYVI